MAEKQNKFAWEDEDIEFDKPGKLPPRPVKNTEMTDEEEDDLITELDEDDDGA